MPSIAEKEGALPAEGNVLSGAKETGAPGWREFLKVHGAVLAVFLVATAATACVYGGDTLDYAAAIEDRYQGRPASSFVDFGHLLWRPLGLLLLRLLYPITSSIVGPGLRANAVLPLLVVNWLAALACVLLLNTLLLRFRVRRLVATLATSAFLFSHAFLNYLHSGSSYVPGLVGIVLAAYLLSEPRPRHRLRVSLLAGAGLAAAVCLWFPYVCAVPWVLLFPLIAFGINRERLRLVAQVAVAGIFLTLVPYAIAAVYLGIDTISELRQWAASSAHGQAQLGSFPKMVFGFARSWLYMGNDGLLYKRFLLRDPYNPVSLTDLMRTSLAKLVLLYGFLMMLVVRLLESRQGRRVFLMLVSIAVPVSAFALYWEAGAIERYMALFPALALVLAFAWDAAISSSSRRWVSVVAIGFLSLTMLSNLRGLYRGTVQTENRTSRAELAQLVARSRPHSKLVIQPYRERVPKRDFFALPELEMPMYDLMQLGTAEAIRWPQEFASMARTTWKSGGDVWITECLTEPKPRAECNWAEGDDQRLSWRAVHEFFLRLELAQAAEPGFILLQPSERNQRLLASIDSSRLTQKSPR